MRIIIKKTGHNTPQDICFVTTDNASQYMKSLKTSPAEVIDYEKEFPHSDPQMLELLKSLIQVNPFFRPTAKECLKNPIFDQVREAVKEKTQISSKIKLDIDHDNAFDYATGVSTLFKQEDYLNIVLKEVSEVHQIHSKSIQ